MITRILLDEESGPVSPRFRFRRRIEAELRQGRLAVHIDDDAGLRTRDLSPTEIADWLTTLDGEALEALRMPAVDVPTGRVGVRINTLEIADDTAPMVRRTFTDASIRHQPDGPLARVVLAIRALAIEPAPSS